MSWSTSVLSTISSDTEPTVVISFDSGKYVFNAGENIGRTWLSSSESWRRTKAVFLTSIGTQRGSGLSGLLMFLSDAGSSRLDVVGPRGLTHFLASMRLYLYRESILIKRTEVDTAAASIVAPEPIFRDDNLTVYGIPLSIGDSSAKLNDETGLLDASDEDLDTAKRKRTSSPEPHVKRARLDEQLGMGEDSNHVDRETSCDSSSTPPTTLTAEEWRRQAVDSMFPCTTLPSQPATTAESVKKPQRGQKPKDTTGKQATVPPFDETSVAIAKPQNDFQYSRKFSLRNKRLPRYTRGESVETLCYVCVGPRVRGKFDAQKARALKIPKGPLMGKLTKGESITFMVDDGKGGQEERIVQPEEVVGPSEAPKVVMILDVPSPAHAAKLRSAFEQSLFYRQLQAESDQYVTSTIYHICGEGVLEDPGYKAFMNAFPSTVHHIVASRKYINDPLTFTGAASNQLILHQVDEQMFPLPKFGMHPPKNLSDIPGLPVNTRVMASKLHISVRPPQPPAHSPPSEQEEQFLKTCTSSEALSLPLDATVAIAHAKEQSHALQSIERPSRPGDDVEVVPLGTCSAAPSKHRNVSSTLIQIPRWGNVLLDCGEGTWGQLVRYFGDDPECSTGVWQALRELKCVFLSHVHGDHHGGVAKLLAMRRKLNPPPTEPLYVIGVHAILLYLRELSDLEDLGIDREDGTGVVTILADALNWRDPHAYGSDVGNEPWMDFDLATKDATKMCQSLDLEDFITVDMRHRTRCYGAVLKHHEGWSIVYSADTMPSDNLARIGANATLLIHEATMADDQADLAQQKAHSTFGQAVEIGHRMKAENILLTHFSTRYPKLPHTMFLAGSSNSSETRPNLVLAFDHARMKLGEMYKFKAYMPAIEQCFGGEQEEDEIIE